MRRTELSVLLAALAAAWLLCGAAAQTKPTNGTATPAASNASAPTVASGPLPAHHGGVQGTSIAAQPVDFTTGNPATLAFVHLSFGINVWNPQMTVPMFNKPGIKALFAQSIKNAVPDAVVVSEALPATKGILVRSTVRFQADAAGAKAQADALVKYLTEASLLKQMLPEANWHPVLVYTTFPYLASAVVYPVGPAADRTPALHFTLRVPGVNKATFDAKKLAAWKTALKTGLPGLTDQGIRALTTEITEPTGRNWYTRTDTLVHTQVTGPILQALRQFSPKLRNKPNTIWSRYTFGAVEAVSRSWLVVAYGPPAASDGVTIYLTFRGKGDPLPFTDQKKQQLAQALLAALNLDPSLKYTAQNIELSVVRTSTATSRRLNGIGDVITVIGVKLKAADAATKRFLQDAADGVAIFFLATAAPIRSWWRQDEVCIAKDEQGTCDPQFAPISAPITIELCRVNMCILLDSSGSTEGEPWSAEKVIAASIVQSVGDIQSQFEIRRFSGAGDVEVIVPVTSRSKLDMDASIVQKILNADNPSTGTDIAGAIRSCTESLLKSNPPAVPPLQNVMILLSDGDDMEDITRQKMRIAAEAAKKAGITMVTIGAGPDLQEQDMKDMSGPGSGLAFTAKQFDQTVLQHLANDAAKAACGAHGGVVSPCPGAAPATICKSLYGRTTDCCACRQTSAKSTVELFGSVPAASYYGSAPNCNSRAAPPLPPGTKVAYTGAKLLGYTGGGCKGDYAQIIVQVGTRYVPAWVLADKLEFCVTRTCGTKVELGAQCDGKTVQCCNLESEGGHPQAVCMKPLFGDKGTLVCQIPNAPITEWKQAKPVAERLLLYSRAIRCEWPEIAAWTCDDCGAIKDTTLEDSFVLHDKYDDASDAFTIHFDAVLNAVVVTFRSTYGNAAGWLNNAMGTGSVRKFGGKNYKIHSGFALTYFDGRNPDPYVGKKLPPLGDSLSNKLVPVLNKYKLQKVSLIFNGHSRGGAMTALAAADFVANRKALLNKAGITNFWQQIKLYTYGQPRVGDAGFAALLESTIGERYRLVSNGEPVPHVPPRKDEAEDPTFVANIYLTGVKQTLVRTWSAIKLAEAQLAFGLVGNKWAQSMLTNYLLSNRLYDAVPFAPSIKHFAQWAAVKGITYLDITLKMLMEQILGGFEQFTHHGTQVLVLDYIDNKGKRVQTEIVCEKSDRDKGTSTNCDGQKALALTSTYTRPSSGRNGPSPYTWIGGTGQPTGTWPFYAMLDHAWYLNVDVGNERCMGKQPAGWYGWKLYVATAKGFTADTDVFTQAKVDCGALASSFVRMTDKTGEDPCELSIAPFDRDCHESEDRELYTWMKHNGTYDWGKGAINQFPDAQQCADYIDKNKGAPTLTLKLEPALIENKWDVDWVVLQLAYTAGSNNKVFTKTWGSCTSKLPHSPTPITVGEDGTAIALCEDSTPRWRWTLKLATANELGPYTPPTQSDIQVSIKCGSFSATNKLIALRPLCASSSLCFERGTERVFKVEHIPGVNYTDTVPPLASTNYPTECMAKSMKPELTVSYTSSILTDDWKMVAAKLKLRLEYQHRDQTSIWGESSAGPSLDPDNEGSYELVTVKKFVYCGGELQPDKNGIITFPYSKKTYQKKFVMCQYT